MTIEIVAAIKEIRMDDFPSEQQVTIAVVPGAAGPYFDQDHLHLPVGATTVWVNETEAPQVILPDTDGTRRVMRLAPAGQQGATWMMEMRSSQRPGAEAGTFRWRLKSNQAAHITIETSTDGGRPG